MADSVIISSTANSYVFVASVSKLNGLKISVKGRSFMISTKEIQKAIMMAFLFNGIKILLKYLKGFNPKFLPVSSNLVDIFSKLEEIGETATAMYLMK